MMGVLVGIVMGNMTMKMNMNIGKLPKQTIIEIESTLDRSKHSLGHRRAMKNPLEHSDNHTISGSESPEYPPRQYHDLNSGK